METAEADLLIPLMECVMKKKVKVRYGKKKRKKQS